MWSLTDFQRHDKMQSFLINNKYDRPKNIVERIYG